MLTSKFRHWNGPRIDFCAAVGLRTLTLPANRILLSGMSRIQPTTHHSRSIGLFFLESCRMKAPWPKYKSYICVSEKKKIHSSERPKTWLHDLFKFYLFCSFFFFVCINIKTTASIDFRVLSLFHFVKNKWKPTEPCFYAEALYFKTPGILEYLKIMFTTIFFHPKCFDSYRIIGNFN